MVSKIKSIKIKLKKYLSDKDILDIILFGSFIKGKPFPNDIDIAIISEKKLAINIEGFHTSVLKPRDFFINPLTIINTLFREGYSLKHNQFFSENFNLSNRVLFAYKLSGLNSSMKVKIVNILRGKNKQKGMVEENKGKWLANQIFHIPITGEDLFRDFFINFKIKFNKYYVLMH